MFRNQLKIALRSLFKNKVSSFVNIGGLAIGITVALLTGLWLYDELSFNTVHENYARIAKVCEKGKHPQYGEFSNSTIMYPLTEEIRRHYNQQFKYLVRSSWNGESILSSGEKKISRQGLYMDEDAPEMFTLKMIYGSRAGLKEMHSVLLSHSTAVALFGESDPVGKIVTISAKTQVTVTGVYEDLPMNAELSMVKYIAPFPLWLSENDWILDRAAKEWWNHFMKMYVQLKPGISIASADRSLEKIIYNNIKNVDDQNYRDHLAFDPKVFLDPMPNWHLGMVGRSMRDSDISPIRMVWMVSLIGGFVLLLACVNFMNLGTARSEKRAKEVGIRKTIGSRRWQLMTQFFSESWAIVCIAFILALGITFLLLGWFNNLTVKDIRIPWINPWFWLLSLAFIFVTAGIAGSYPALYLSSFKPIQALKGKLSAANSTVIPRKVLVVFQFTISVILINCTLVILRQVRHAQERPAGYNRDGLLMIQMKNEDFNNKYSLFRNELLSTGVVQDFAESMGRPTELASNNGGFTWQGMDPKKDQNYGTLAISADYGRTIGWQVVQGRDFSPEISTDSAGMIINESAMKEMGLTNPVGTLVTWTWWQDKSQVMQYKIIGVVKDMVMESPNAETKATVFYQKGFNGGLNWMLIKVKPTVSMSKALASIESVMKRLVPSAPFEYKFTDEDYANKFASEVRMSKLAGFFASLAILISALGLFALAAFTVERRTKELGVRKVLGASAAGLWKLLSTEFMVLVLISMFIAMPVSWYFMEHWLEQFVYRISISPLLFGLAGAGAILIALATVSLHTIQASRANPVNSLRSE